MPKHIEIVDEFNRPTGRQATINQSLDKGLWHRGAVVVVCTKTGFILVQKRSSNMRMHPGQLDISAGGFVDIGEDPEDTAIREVHEELGLTIHKSQLNFLYIHRKNHVLPRRQGFSRAFVYCYVICLPDEHVSIVPQAEEVAWARFLPYRTVRRMALGSAIRHIGRFEPRRAYYRRLLLAAKPFMKH
ncbi:NUDIX domain-containing protein [Candidatus Saccharibacteria bacterium]|nr:NUDIX domain-containing protein [Candidatus Saccharibacteria bacterium]